MPIHRRIYHTTDYDSKDVQSTDSERRSSTNRRQHGNLKCEQIESTNKSNYIEIRTLDQK